MELETTEGAGAVQPGQGTGALQADSADASPVVVAAVSSEQAVPGRVDDEVRKPLDHRAVALERLTAGIFSAIFSIMLIGGVSVPVIVAPLPRWVDILLIEVAATVSVFTICFNYVWPEVSHRYKSYTVSPLSVEIRKGVIWRKVVSVPRSRVQHTDVSQGPLERRFGLGTLMIYTAGTEHSKVELRGLEYQTAALVRDHLLPSGDDDAV